MAIHKEAARKLERAIGAERKAVRRLKAVIEDTHETIRRSEALLESSRGTRQIALWDELCEVEARELPIRQT